MEKIQQVSDKNDSKCFNYRIYISEEKSHGLPFISVISSCYYLPKKFHYLWTMIKVINQLHAHVLDFNSSSLVQNW